MTRAAPDEFMRNAPESGSVAPEGGASLAPDEAQWPASLRAALRLIRSMPNRAALCVGPDLMVFCNAPLISEIGPAAPLSHGIGVAELAQLQGQSGWASLQPALQSCFGSGQGMRVADFSFGTTRLSADLSVLSDEQGQSQAVLCLFALQPVVVRSPRRKPIDRQDPKQAAAIIRGSGDAIFSIDLEGKVTSWNEGAARLYGYCPVDIIGKSVQLLLPEGKSTEEDALLQRIREGQGIESYHTNRLHRSGRIIPVSLRVSPIFDDQGQVVGASKIARDISAQVETDAMRDMLMSEMKHRVKNTLATVLAIARQSFGRKGSDEASRFTARISALSRAQDLLTREAVDGAEMGAVVRRALAPFPEQNLTITGPTLHLGPRSVLLLTLCLHELATNAAKYGALSTAEGQVTVNWQLHLDADGAEPEQIVGMHWHENGGPQVAPPAHRGFGSVLITNVLRLELGAQTDVEFNPEGVRFSARVARDRLSI